MKKSKIFLTLGLLAFMSPGVTFSQEKTEKHIRVNIRIIEGDNHQITPAMVCIIGVKDSKVRIPPDAAIPDSPSHTSVFYKGVDYKKEKNWIGPIRKMSGLGDNDDRSYVYELVPSIPYWREPVMYQTSGDFSIDLPPGKWQISIEHGNEFIPIQEEFDVSQNEKEKVKTFVLKRWINLPQMGW